MLRVWSAPANRQLSRANTSKMREINMACIYSLKIYLGQYNPIVKNKLSKYMQMEDMNSIPKAMGCSIEYLLVHSVLKYFEETADKFKDLLTKYLKNTDDSLSNRGRDSPSPRNIQNTDLTPEEFSWLKISTPFTSLLKKLRVKLLVHLQQVYIYIYINRKKQTKK